MKNKRKFKRIFTIVLIVTFAVLIGFLVTYIGKGKSAEKKETGNSGTNPNTIIMTATDYQQEEGFPPPKETLKEIMQAVEKDGKEPDCFIMCGDYSNDRELHDYQVNPDDAIKEIRNISKSVFPDLTGDRLVFVQGNHDSLTDSITESGLHEFDEYLIYVLNTQEDFPWKQGRETGTLQKVEESSKDMKDCFDMLIERSEKRPVIIAGHVPLHYTGRTSSLHTTGDNIYSSLIFDVANEAGKDLDIIYLFGHNHSKGWDAYMGGSCAYKSPGDIVLIPEFNDMDLTTDKFTERKLNFTYANAGYVGYYMNCSITEIGNGTKDDYDVTDDTLTVMLIEIYDDKILLNRYSTDGKHQLSDEGRVNPYKNDRGLIPEKYYSKRIEGTQTIKRKQ
ncbi:MAG TPA: hypothetical protein GX736_06365 [Mogibacterium sp.]|nr:hypothetical protein [Mogibacterium sp.]